MSKLSGNAHQLTIGATQIHTTKVTPKVTKQTSDSSDTGGYDATDKLIHTDQVTNAVSTELSVEGYWYTGAAAGATMAVLESCYSGNAIATGTVKVTATDQLLTGSWDITDFEADLSALGTVAFKATYKNKGKVTRGAPTP